MDVFEIMREEETNTQKKLITQTSKRETELVEMSKNYIRMFAAGKINQEQLDEFSKEVDDELALVRGQQKETHTRIVDWFKTASNYLNFANNAVERFNNGTTKEREVILRAFGSNQVIKDKKLVITLPKAYLLMKEGYVAISSQSEWLEPEKALVIQGLSSESERQIPIWLRPLFLARTSILKKEEAILI